MIDAAQRGVSFRPYTSGDQPACLGIFDANCPEFFAPNERYEFVGFLSEHAEAYRICVGDGTIRGGFGLLEGEQPGAAYLRWILIEPSSQSLGLGSQMMEAVRARALDASITEIDIGASHKSAAFFARFGAVEIDRTVNGWGAGMHRIDMRWRLS